MKTTKTCLLIDDDFDDQEIFVTAVEEIGAAGNCQVLSNGEDVSFPENWATQKFPFQSISKSR